MSGVTEPTVDDLPAEADLLQVLEVELGSIAEEDVREPHRHAYHELIWIREGRGQHLIDGEWVEDGLAGEVGRRVLFTGTGCTSLRPPEDEAARFDALLDLLRVEASRPANRESAELRRHLLSASLLWAQRWRVAQLEEGGATRSDVQLHQRFLETLERDFASSHDAGHYARELGVSPGTLSRILTRLTRRTTKQLILERVILEAVRLLRFSDLSIKEIADRLGFSDQFAFSKAFKRQRGEGAAALS